MYNEVHDKVLEAIMTVALNQIMYEEDESFPSDDKLAKMYPTSKKMMRKYRNKVKERWYRNPLPVVYLKRVSIIVLTVISVMFGVLTTSGEVRAAIANTVVTWYDKYVNIDFNDSVSGDTIDATTEIPEPDSLTIGYIPEAFELSSSEEHNKHREYMYLSDNGDYIMLGIYATETTDFGVDSEYSEFEQLVINGNEAYLMYDEDDKAGTLLFGNDKYTVTISAIIDKNELIKIAENIK